MRLILCILVAVIVVIGLTGISGCTEEKEINNSISDVQAPLENQTPVKATAQPTAVKSAATIGVTAKYQGTYVSDNQFEQPAAGNKYVQIYVTVTNVNDPGALIGNQFFFTLFDSNHVGHQPTLASFGEGGLQSISNSNPGQKTAGTLIFEMPKGAKPVSLIYNDYTNNLTMTL